MLKTREYYVCDRCQKEIKEGEEISTVLDTPYRYELCENCKKKYDEMEEKVNKHRKALEEEYKKYQFGEFLPIIKDTKEGSIW